MTMVEILDGWYFKIDEFQYVLVHKYEKAKGVFGKVGVDSGEVVTKQDEVGYFKTVAAMLRRLAEILAREKVADGQIQTVRDYIDELERIEKKLHEICRGY
jgi:hypothetical protein